MDIYTYYNGGFIDPKYKWRIEGGNIESASNTRPVDTLKVKWNSTDTVGKICITFSTQCNQIEEYCQIVKLKKNTATYDDSNDKAFEILPNPNQGSFTVNTTNSTKIRDIKIFNSNGVSIKFTVNDSNSKTKEIKLSEKQTGIYYLQLNTSQGIIYKKLMITN
ncbi:MAG: T9SS type A sorting domain-containing protein [Saprospiraceae bacterium]|nr:T9SS type A sorting domain-containing protein [Saprospiraceae bacterium]